MAIILQHPDLGELKGNVVDGTAQFLGIQYATLENRFAQPQVRTQYKTSTDASQYGPPPVSPIGAINQEFGFIQHSLPLPNVPQQSDTEGLNLNITLPLGQNGAVRSDAKLPVYVFIHGGGFVVGSSWYPHYDPVRLVQLSIQKRKPVIGITINYRLGVTGFMTSAELRKAGYKANNGFHDQRAAMKWIKRFIGGFGGDGEETTVVGESAGSMSVIMFLTSKEPLMKRCLSTGGALLLFKALPQEAAEATYQTVIKAFGLEDKSPEDRINALMTLPMEYLWQKVPIGTLMSPYIDEQTAPGEPSFSALSLQDDDPRFLMPGRKWCSAFMIGESKLDANILAYLGLDERKPGIASKFIESTKKTLAAHSEAASALLSAYNITTSMDDETALLAILHFASEISFYALALAFAKGWPHSDANKFFLYHFNEEIPWDGRFKGHAGHILDVSYLFQNFNDFLSDEQRAVAEAYGSDFIDFVNGNDPWSPVGGGRMCARVYGPSSQGITTKFVTDGKPEDVGRHDRVLRLGEQLGFEKVREVFENFFKGQ